MPVGLRPALPVAAASHSPLRLWVELLQPHLEEVHRLVGLREGLAARPAQSLFGSGQQVHCGEVGAERRLCWSVPSLSNVPTQPALDCVASRCAAQREGRAGEDTRHGGARLLQFRAWWLHQHEKIQLSLQEKDL